MKPENAQMATMTKMSVATEKEHEEASSKPFEKCFGLSEIPLALKLVSLTAIVGSIYHLTTFRFSESANKASVPKLMVFPGPSRFAPLDPNGGGANFVHISKCAGESWINELKSWLPNLYPPRGHGLEMSIPWQRTKKPRQYTLTGVKSPRHHVWSLFTECKYDDWGRKTTNRTGFPRSGENPTADLVDFEAWLDAFLDISYSDNPKGSQETEYTINEKRRKGFGYCYHPANYMSRAFVVNHSNPHFVVEAPPGMDPFEPSIEEAIKTYWSLEWVGTAELFDESKCLLYYRFMEGESGKPDSNDTIIQRHRDNALKKTRDYLDNDCMCPPPKNSSSRHEVHHLAGHRKSMKDGVSHQVLEKIDTLTRVDVKLYKHAIVELMKELVWLEEKLKRRVLCDSKLESLNYELEYLGLGNLTQLYHLMMSKEMVAH